MGAGYAYKNPALMFNSSNNYYSKVTKTCMKHNVRSCLHCVSMLKYISAPRNIAECKCMYEVLWLDAVTIVSNRLEVARNNYNCL